MFAAMRPGLLKMNIVERSSAKRLKLHVSSLPKGCHLCIVTRNIHLDELVLALRNLRGGGGETIRGETTALTGVSVLLEKTNSKHLPHQMVTLYQ